MEAVGGTGETSTGKVEEGRRNLRRLTVEEEEREQASSDRVGKVKAAALEAWGRLKGMLGGKKLVVSEKGTCQVNGENEEVGRGEESIQLEDIAGEAEDGVLILIEDEEATSVVSETLSVGGVSFLDCIQEEEIDEELEMRLEGMRKRKHDGVKR
jgi:hypothetical protein